MAQPNLNSPKPPLAYRIGQSERVVGTATSAPNGFSVLNLATTNIFVAENGVWTAGGNLANSTAPFNFPALLATWYGTDSTMLMTAGTEPALTRAPNGSSTGGAGFRIGNSDRIVGGPTGAPNGFYVLNLSTGNVFQAEGGVWTQLQANSFPADLMAAYEAS